MGDTQAEPASASGHAAVSGMRIDGESDAASSELSRRVGGALPLSSVSRQSGFGGRDEEAEAASNVRHLQHGVSVEVFAQTQNLQRGVLVGARQTQRDEAMDDTVNRVNRLKALGNAIVPPVAMIFAGAIYDLLHKEAV
jgi:hypothetical protein